MITRKRFKTEDQIIAEIDIMLKSVPDLKLRASELRIRSEMFSKERKDNYNARECLTQSDRLFKKARNIEDGKGRIRTFKDKLAQIRTEVMPFMAGDRSIPR